MNQNTATQWTLDDRLLSLKSQLDLGRVAITKLEAERRDALLNGTDTDQVNAELAGARTKVAEIVEAIDAVGELQAEQHQAEQEAQAQHTAEQIEALGRKRAKVARKVQTDLESAAASVEAMAELARQILALAKHKDYTMPLDRSRVGARLTQFIGRLFRDVEIDRVVQIEPDDHAPSFSKVEGDAVRPYLLGDK